MREVRRQTKNAYQHHIHVYTSRLETAKSFATKLRLRAKIREFKRAIKRIETREVVIKKGIKLVESYFGNEFKIIQILQKKFSSGAVDEREYQARCMFFKYMVDNRIDSGALAIYFYRTKLTEVEMSRLKTRSYATIRTTPNLKTKYNQFKQYANNER